MRDPKACQGDPQAPDPSESHKEARGSEFEDLLRCASEVLRGGAKTAPGAVETKNPHIQG
jgi:hypothetical protein